MLNRLVTRLEKLVIREIESNILVATIIKTPMSAVTSRIEITVKKVR